MRLVMKITLAYEHHEGLLQFPAEALTIGSRNVVIDNGLPSMMIIDNEAVSLLMVSWERSDDDAEPGSGQAQELRPDRSPSSEGGDPGRPPAE